MEQFNIFPPIPSVQPKTGQLLIAEPLLNDPNFSRSVILLCEHNAEGSVGFVLNHTTDFTLNDLMPETRTAHIGIYEGGPVQMDTLHLLHRVPEVINGGIEVAKGIYWGGYFEELKEMAYHEKCTSSTVRLFKGYSGWAAGQLEKEIKEGTWLVADANSELLFDTRHEYLWKKAISLLGKKYNYLTNMPIDPQLN